MIGTVARSRRINNQYPSMAVRPERLADVTQVERSEPPPEFMASPPIKNTPARVGIFHRVQSLLT